VPRMSSAAVTMRNAPNRVSSAGPSLQGAARLRLEGLADSAELFIARAREGE